MNTGLQGDRMDDPEFRDAEIRIQGGLLAHVITKTGVGDLHNEFRRSRSESLPAALFWIEDEIRLKIGVVAHPKGRLGNEEEFGGELSRPIDIQRGLHYFVVIALRRHRHDLPTDQLDALVFPKDA